MTVLALVLAAGLAALYMSAEGLGVLTTSYDVVDEMATANRSAANAAAELVEQVVLDNIQPAGTMLVDPELVKHDLYPSNEAGFDDDVYSSPDLVLTQGQFTSFIDVDYVPLTSGFSWTSIKFGSAYQEAAAGNASSGALTYRLHVLTTRGSGAKYETEAVYIVNR